MFLYIDPSSILKLEIVDPPTGNWGEEWGTIMKGFHEEISIQLEGSMIIGKVTATKFETFEPDQINRHVEYGLENYDFEN